MHGKVSLQKKRSAKRSKMHCEESFIFVWTVFSLVLGSPSEDCAGLAAAGDCEFYTCLDKQLGGCGRGAYPLGFGYKYCRRFQDSRELFDQEAGRSLWH